MCRRRITNLDKYLGEITARAKLQAVLGLAPRGRLRVLKQHLVGKTLGDFEKYLNAFITLYVTFPLFS